MSYSVVPSRVKRGSLMNSEPRKADMSVFLAEVTTDGGDGAGKGLGVQPKAEWCGYVARATLHPAHALDECGIMGNT
jgi:hypothetical protein